MGESKKTLIDHADSEDFLNCEHVEHSIEEHVVRQVIETKLRVKPSIAQVGRPGEVKSRWGRHCQQ